MKKHHFKAQCKKPKQGVLRCSIATKRGFAVEANAGQNLSPDELFEQAHEAAMARINQYEERIVTTLKGHLAAEQALNRLLTVARRRKRGRRFVGKMFKAKGLFVREMSEKDWEVLAVGNDLRSAIAHGDKQGTIDAKVVELRKALIAANPTQQQMHIEAMTERQMIASAFNHCIGRITVAADRIGREGNQSRQEPR